VEQSDAWLIGTSRTERLAPSSSHRSRTMLVRSATEDDISVPCRRKQNIGGGRQPVPGTVAIIGKRAGSYRIIESSHFSTYEPDLPNGRLLGVGVIHGCPRPRTNAEFDSGIAARPPPRVEVGPKRVYSSKPDKTPTAGRRRCR